MKSIDVKNLYNNVPLKDSIKIALQKLYSQEFPPENQKATIKTLSKMAFENTFSAKYISIVIIHGIRKLMY